MTTARLIAAFVALVLAAAACSTTNRPELADVALAPPTTTPSTSTSTTTTQAPWVQPPAPNGRTYPTVPATQQAAADRLYEVERLIRTTDTAAPEWPDLAHEQQMLYRTIGRHPDWIRDTIDGSPPEYTLIIERQLAARRAIAGIGSGEGEGPVNVPAWEIIDPLPVDELRELYEQASAETGVDWAFLAAINLIETGFGRIDGLSTAGAQGPMQFLPTTFEEVSNGDIDDPHDAIPAAAAYLVRRGGPDDMHRAILGYNNSNAYVAAVTHYANLFRDDERSFLAAYSWEIHYSAAIGDLSFPVGYRRDEAQRALDYLADAPWSAPPPSS